MPSYDAFTVTRANPAAAWAAWTDVGSWSAHEHIESASIDGEFRVGARITTKARGFPRSSLTVTHADRPHAWSDESRSPGIRMTFDHVIEQGDMVVASCHVSAHLAGQEAAGVVTFDYALKVTLAGGSIAALEIYEGAAAAGAA